MIVGELGNCYSFRGSDSTGGVSATTEFPLSWYDVPDDEDELKTSQTSDNRLFSWHILKQFQVKAMTAKNKWASGNAENTVCNVGNYNAVNVPLSVTLSCTSDVGNGNGVYFTGTFDEGNNWNTLIRGMWNTGNVWTVTITTTTGSFEWKAIKADYNDSSKNRVWQNDPNNSYPTTTSINYNF